MEHLAAAQHQVVLVAPFIKRPILEMCVEAVHPLVPIRVYTRWDPAEVAAGVSDPEIIAIPRLEEAVRLVPTLHAKAYIADELALVGSANLTQRALGFGSSNANVELLIQTRTDVPEVTALLHNVETTARVANANFAAAVRERAFVLSDRDATNHLAGPTRFYPTARDPGRLIPLYRHAQPEYPADNDPEADLMRLAIPVGLSDEDVREFIVGVLRHHPDLVPLYSTGVLNSSTLQSAIIAELGVSEIEATRRVDTLVRWLQIFSGDIRTQPASFDVILGKEFA